MQNESSGEKSQGYHSFTVVECMNVLMEACDYKDKRSFRQSVLNEMLNNGLIGMTHPENPNHRNQRYKILEVGA